ncbi:SRPBCC family protein [Arenimonas composti]|uniref:Polyketide cyclase/dehydrase n=1 Tax=Arenimonas composti TR7-09 = DSM 18010 TaxID=1121013 RepID=A0A091B943_9GAMM|nr:SRPBCC family protein [Arenimonas composti]KFN47359.1 hypothetical protein P873_01575 [Arenimonas composti TR7-09 = DSM 18010]
MRRVRPLAVLVAAASIAFAAAAPARVLDRSASGFTLQNEAVVPVAPDAAWAALVGEVDAWWPRDHRWWSDSRLAIEPRAGGCFCELAGERQALHMLVTFVDPGRTLRMTGGLGPLQGMGLHGALEFRLQPEAGGGTRITLWYRAGGYLPDGAPAGDPADLVGFVPIIDRVQAQQLGGLATKLGGSVITGPAAATAD